jgi:Zn-dependent M32 family carboxypeptidase
VQPKLAALFPEKFGGHVTAEELYTAVNVVKQVSLIRVEADEVGRGLVGRRDECFPEFLHPSPLLE